MVGWVWLLSLPLQGGVAAAAPTPPTQARLDSYSLCISEGTEPSGKARYVSDPFETGLDEMDARGFGEYVEQAYLHRRNSNYRTTCASYARRSAADAALVQATTPLAGVRIVATKWRANFE